MKIFSVSYLFRSADMGKQKLNRVAVQGPDGDKLGATKKANAVPGWASPQPAGSLARQGDKRKGGLA